MILPTQIAQHVAHKIQSSDPRFLSKGNSHLFRTDDLLIRVLAPSLAEQASEGFDTALWLYHQEPLLVAEPLHIFSYDGWSAHIWRWREGDIAQPDIAHDAIHKWRDIARDAPQDVFEHLTIYTGPMRSVPMYLEKIAEPFHAKLIQEYELLVPVQKEIFAQEKMYLMHGDIHAGNVMSHNGQGFLIDWDLASQGPIWSDWVKWACQYGIDRVQDPNLSQSDIDKLATSMQLYRFAKVCWALDGIYRERTTLEMAHETWDEYAQLYESTFITVGGSRV